MLDHPTSHRLRAALLAALLAAACDDSFDPIGTTELRYSIFGYLDAAADTQWIRVMPIRPLVPTSPDSFGARVTLEHVETGRIIELRDSLFLFKQYQHPDAGSEGLYVHNYWTTERMQQGASYRLSVRRNGEDPSEALIVLPVDFGLEVLLSQNSSLSDSLRATGVRSMPFVTASTSFWDTCGPGTQGLSFTGRSGSTDTHVIAIRKPGTSRSGCGSMVILGRGLWVVGSKEAWPAGAEYSTWRLGVPHGTSGVSHSLGFVGGVLTKRVPYENCELGGAQPIPSHCRLRYDSTTATLRGMVTETRCGKGPLDSALVQLREVRNEPGAHPRLRTTLTNYQGEFAIGGLEPGVEHLLTVRSPTRPVIGIPPTIVTMYGTPSYTLRFASGGQVYQVVGVSQLSECWMNP